MLNEAGISMVLNALGGDASYKGLTSARKRGPHRKSETSDNLPSNDGASVTHPREAPPPVANIREVAPTSESSGDRHRDEQTLRDGACALYLYGSLAKVLGLGHDTTGYLEYRNRLLRDCGGPTDPIEIMLIENLALLFHCAGRMHVQSAYATEADASVAYTVAAARLHAEFRRGALALKEYRSRATPATQPAQDHVADEPKQESPGRRNGKTRKQQAAIPAKGTAKEKSLHGKVGSNGNGHGEIPPCLQKRFELPVHVE